MADQAVFLGPNGSDPGAAIRQVVSALSNPTVGDLLYVGQGYRSRIRERTLSGIDVNGAPFAAYSAKGPYYFYANKDSTSGRSAAGKKARATAAAGRFAKTGRIGIRTPTGIKYESYGAAKSAHGVANVNLFGMEQHTHMLDTMIVRTGGAESAGGDLFGAGGEADEFSAFEQNSPANQLTVGFYGTEEARARGNNEGTGTLPKREFFALNAADLSWGERAIAERMMIRARRTA